LSKALAGPRETKWVNLGGQLMPEKDVDTLRQDIKTGKCRNWHEIHQTCQRLWQEKYPLQKRRHAYATLLAVLGTDELTEKHWSQALDRALEAQHYIAEQTYQSRKKDFENPFRQIACRNDAEKLAVFGTVEENPFVRQVREETQAFEQRVQSARSR
jgi:hypothetical protein